MHLQVLRTRGLGAGLADLARRAAVERRAAAPASRARRLVAAAAGPAALARGLAAVAARRRAADGTAAKIAMKIL